MSLHLPILRAGEVYESLDTVELKNLRGGASVALVSQANAGMLRRDMAKIGAARRALRAVPAARLLEICARAGELFMREALPMGMRGETQTPQEYIESLSATTGLPHALCRLNMGKVQQVFAQMPQILRGLTRGMDVEILRRGEGQHDGVPVSFYALADALTVILPSNSPGVNSIWMPAIALGIPVVLKPGREDPWTPLRIIQAFIAAGAPQAFSFYPTDHEGSNALMQLAQRALIFGDENTVARHASNPAVQVHGPGRSKVLIGDDDIENWRDYVDVIAESIAANGGRSCVNASTVVAPKYGREIAAMLAEKLAQLKPLPHDDERAILAGFANPQMAEMIDAAIDADLPGAEDCTAQIRNEARRVELENSSYLQPTVVWCPNFAHPLANREFLFPFASVVEAPQSEMLNLIGPSLVVTAITRDENWIGELLQSPLIDRLNIGPLPTNRVSWEQPHEGNLFEFLFKRRAIARAGF